MKQDMQLQDPVAGPKQVHNELPTMRSRVRMELASVASNGDASMVFVWEESRIAPEATVEKRMRSVLDNMLVKFVGLHGTARITPRGESRDLVLEPPANPDPLVTRSHEPVGVGARWEITTMTAVLGASVSSTMRYELVHLEGNAVTCEVDVTQQASVQPLTLQDGVSGDLKQLVSHGHGTVTFLLDRLVPTGKLAMTSTFQFTFASGGTEMLADMKMDIAISTRPAN
jgi:hypothetical protein